MSRASRIAGAAGAVALAVMASRRGAAALGPLYGGEVRVALDALPPRFDPAPTPGASARLVAALVHERLVDVGPDAAPAPALAEGWTEAAGGREYALRMREGAAFHDGALVTAADVVRSLRRFLRAPSAAAGRLADLLEGGAEYRAGTEALAGVTAEGPDIVLRLRAPSSIALAALAAPAAAVTGARGSGAGPFVPTTGSPIQGRAQLVAFPRHLRGRPFLDTVALAASPVGRERDLDAGRADVLASIGAGPPSATLLLVLDPRYPPLDRPEARGRIAAAVDGPALVRDYLEGGVASSALLPRALLEAPLAAPRSRAAQAVRGSLTLVVSTEVPVAASQRVVAYMGSPGIQVSARPVFAAEAWTAPAAARLLLFTPEVADPLIALDELAMRAPAADSVQARALRAEAATELDRDRRAGLLRRAEAALRAGSILIPLAGVGLGFRSRAGVHGVDIDGSGRIRLENAWVEP